MFSQNHWQKISPSSVLYGTLSASFAEHVIDDSTINCILLPFEQKYSKMFLSLNHDLNKFWDYILFIRSYKYYDNFF